MEGLKINEEKTLYEIITNLKNENTFCILALGRCARITFTPRDVRITSRSKGTHFIAIGSSNLSGSVDDHIKFKKFKETDDWSHFLDCNNLGYELSIKNEE